MTWRGEPPELPDWAPLDWPETPALSHWKKRIPVWVAETLRRLPPARQLHLLYLCARYPQMLEMLDRMPLLAWRIAQRNMDEQTLKRLFPAPRTRLAQSVGWPDDRSVIVFLQKLRLKRITPQSLRDVEICLHRPEAMEISCQLPRINGMALALAARFPQLSGSILHQSLARQPCQPSQCEKLRYLLADTLQLAKALDKDLQPVRQCRFLIEVERLYDRWLQEALSAQSDGKEVRRPLSHPDIRLPTPWQWLQSADQALKISERTKQVWFLQRDGMSAWHPELRLGAALNRTQTGRWTIQRARAYKCEALTPAQQAELEMLLASLNARKRPVART